MLNYQTMSTNPKTQIQQYCWQNDESAFEAFYQSQSDRLWRFLIAKGVDTDTAYDLLAESFIRFLKTICNNPESPVALLYRIALNLYIDYHRRHKISPVQYEEMPPDIPVDTLVLEQEYELLYQQLNTLKENEQNLLIMRYWIGFTHKEIATILELPEGTVRRQAATVIKKLAEKLK